MKMIGCLNQTHSPGDPCGPGNPGGPGGPKQSADSFHPIPILHLCALLRPVGPQVLACPEALLNKPNSFCPLNLPSPDPASPGAPGMPIGPGGPRGQGGQGGGVTTSPKRVFHIAEMYIR